MCSTPKSETPSKTTATSSSSSAKFSQAPLTSSTGPSTSTVGNVKTENLGKVKEATATAAGPRENINNNNNDLRSGKTSSTTRAKNKQEEAGRTNFQEISEGCGEEVVVDVDDDARRSRTAFRGATAVSLERGALSSDPSALTTALAAGLGRSAAGSRLAPGNQPIFGGGGGGKGMTSTSDADSDPVYPKTGELIDNYGPNNAIISDGGPKRKNARVLNSSKRNPAQVSNNSKRRANGGSNKLLNSSALKADSDFFLTTASGDEDGLQPSDEIIYASGPNPSGVPLTLVEEESSEILKRIDPEDLGIAVDAHGNQTVVVTSVQGGGLMQDVILYNGSPALLVNGLSGHPMPPASSSPTDSNSSNGSDLSSSPPLGSSGGSYVAGKYTGNGSGGGITLYPASGSSILGLSHHHHQFPHHGEYSSQLSGSTVITSIADMASLLSQNVKNEPEDLTGARRDNPNNNNDPHSDTLQSLSNSQSMLKSGLDSKNGSPPVVVTTSDGQVVLSTDLSNATFVPVGPPHGVPGDHPPYGSDFPGPPFDGSGRVIYPGDSYRTADNDMYNPAPSPDFASTVQRVVSGDVQFVQYYKGGQLPPGPPGHGPNHHMNSPDSGIGDAALSQGQTEAFDAYPHADILNDSYRKWNNDFRAPNEEKIQIPKIFSPYGFKYTMETPTSGSVRREDDRITYINKGQFYGLTLEYIMDPESPPLKSNTVKSVIMLCFREGKSSEDELKAWQFWHGRQHSVKQRILDPDQKNSTGIVGSVEETLALNALVVYWNPLESPAKVNIAVQCLSTDFSTQKGVKGLPLHLQIDTYDDPRDPNAPVYHRGYAQIKVFCDKGAERKARDEERRASKRRTTPSGKRRLDEMYHTPLERSEFYSMVDLSRPPVLFSPPDPDKAALEFGSDIPSFYSRGSPPDPMLKLNGSIPPTPEQRSHYSPGEPKLMRWDDAELDPQHQQHLFEPSLARPIHLDGGELSALDISIKKEHHLLAQGLSGPLPEKRPKLLPLPHERIMIYVRQETEDAYTPLHLVPPSVPGLIRAIESKYKINARNIRYLYKKNKEGALVKLDDDMIKYYCNEDAFLMQVMVTEGLGGEESMVYDITLSET